MQFETPTGPVTVNVRDAVSLWTAVRGRLQAGEGFSLATLNLDHLDKLRRDRAFAAAYDAQDFVTADGNPIVWLSHLAGQPLALLPGADLVEPLAQIAAAEGRAVALLGSTEAALTRAAGMLERCLPGVTVALKIAPPMGFDPDGQQAAEMLEEVRASGVGLCFLALGAPKQERLAARGRKMAPGVGFVCIGAGLDFLAGSQVRAPIWVREFALEWLWRMLNDPRRLGGRYARSALILPGHTLRAWRMRRRVGAPQS